jgi:hypothetical protein
VSRPALDPGDARLLQRIRSTTDEAAALLCTLARRGKAFERDHPDRATLLLAALRPNPLYKGGRLAFDMLEIEDLMLDSPPEEVVEDARLAELVRQLSAGWHTMALALTRPGAADSSIASAPSGNGNGAVPPRDPGSLATAPSDATGPIRLRFGPEEDGDGRSTAGETAAPDPELRSSDYLYDLVVLGLLRVASGPGSSGR